jgi:feruloyl-CoA synthase
MLCQALEADAALSRHFFSRLKFLGFGGAVLAEEVRDRLIALSIAARGTAAPIFSFYGATEYLFGTLKYWTEGGTDIIGLPLPATDLKLVPFDGRYEMRVKGPTLMPQTGYIGAPEASATRSASPIPTTRARAWSSRAVCRKTSSSIPEPM